ncbi:MAG TPA: filamentous hemagglutinin N-terminal domain-containing protein, partial [Steroidobacteraceae bacterium]|nr:filamentous hemagglutinin N-terminal domain-containing protein [Steroidobacteraceae bacterium]
MKLRPRPSRVSRSAIAQAVTAALTYGHVGLAAPPPVLPVPCFPGTCAPGATPGFNTKLPNGTSTGPGGFVTYGSASATQTGNRLTVNQSSGNAILNWASFNIGAGAVVQFVQPSSTAVALNKIYQSSPSSIFGTLNANGQVWLINPNGFVFGSSATVNVGGLMASSLGLYGGDAQFTGGSLASNTGPALQSDGRIYVTDATGNPVLDANGVPEQVQIEVQPGATLTAGDAGRIMLAGQVVDNAGSLSSPDGQVLLAAGQTIYLQSSSDSSLRGLLVEVSNTTPAGSAPTGPPSPAPNVPVGTAANLGGGSLSAPRGNVSLIGLAVNQSGRISATTSVSENGSVILQAAQGTISGSSNSAQLLATQGGTLTLGPTSDIEVLPEISNTAATAAVAQPQMLSSVQLYGEAVYMDGGTINAPGGNLSVLAAAQPSQGLLNEGNTAAQIRVGAGVNIDLAGTTANLPMSSNVEAVQLFGNELEDDPQQRTGPLHGQTVDVDLQDGRPPLISASSWLAILQGLQENVAQRMAAGGSVSFQSEGDLVIAQGSTINVSGGAWNYAAGPVQTSQLQGADGHTYSIETANPALAYVGVLNPTYTQSFAGFGVQTTGTTPGLGGQIQSAYTQGFSAGTVRMAAPAMVMQGTLVGTAVNGAFQRSGASIPADSLAAVVANGGTIPSSGTVAMASGGTLVIGDPVGPAAQVAQGSLPQFFAPAVTFTAHPAPVSVADGAALPPQPLQLAPDYLGNGFQNTEIFSDSAVTVPAALPLNLGSGGSLLVVAPNIRIGSGITAPGGAINLESVDTARSSAITLRPGISVADNVTLDVGGQWTNDSSLTTTNPQGATLQDGGSITLSLALNPNWLPVAIWPAATEPSLLGAYSSFSPGGELSLGNGVSLLADGGAWLKSNNTLTGGTGGTINIGASPFAAGLQVGTGTNVQAFGVQGAAGGSFALQAPRILVQDGSSWSTAQAIDDSVTPGEFFAVGSALFSNDGFSRVGLTATGLAAADSASNDVLTVAADTTIDAAAQSLQLSGSYIGRRSGGEVLGFTEPQLFPLATQTPSALSFVSQLTNSYFGNQIIMGDVDVQPGAIIEVGPGATGSIALASQGSILESGTLRAPGGSISAHITVPTTLNDPGYVRGQDVDIGDNAVLNVSGAIIATPNSLNLPLGTVLPGGSITLTADRGGIVADGGSLIDIAGASAELDVLNAPGSGYLHTLVGSAAGALTLVSSESISLLATLSAAGGQGAPAQGAIDGGSLNVQLRAPLGAASGNTSPTLFVGPYSIQLVQSIDSTTQPDFSGSAVLGINQLQQSGIDSLTLSAGNAPVDAAGNVARGSIMFTSGGSPTLSMGRQITLDAPIISLYNSTQATVSAPYVVLTDSQQIPTQEAARATAASTGTGALTINAQEIGLSGYTWIQSAGNVTLNTVNDVQLLPVNATQASGALYAGGNLNVTAARVYPATLANYALNAGGDVSINRTAGSPIPATPLSVGGTLAITANDINDNGVVVAPFGAISLSAANQLALGPNSYISVSSDGSVLPFGQTTYGGQEWVYSAGNDTAAVTGIGSLPTTLVNGAGTGSRTVTLSAQGVQFQSGSTVDVGGGGDISAYEWVPGLGGSTDALGLAQAAAGGLYAILPSAGPFAAYDLQEFTGSNTAIGRSVYLSGVPGLAAGFYALLPARYALLPGAYLVQAEPSYRGTTSGQLGSLANGTAVVAGYYSFGNGSAGLTDVAGSQGLRASSGYTGFAVYPGSYGQQLAQYDVATGTQYFGQAAATAAPGAAPTTLPADAGTLAVAVGSTLTLGQGSKVNTQPGTSGAAGSVDIYTVASSAQGSTAAQPASIYVGDAGQAPAGDVVINPASLEAWNAGNLLLGGNQQAGGAINVTAGSVEFGAGASLTAGQITAVANSSIDVDAGATLTATGPGVVQPQAVTLAGGANTAHDAALLAVSNSTLPVLQRTGAGDAAAASITVSPATLNGNAVALDAPAAVTVADGSTLGTRGASISLASNSVGFVSTGGAPNSDALQIDPMLLAQLNQAGSVRIASAGNIDLLAPTTLGPGTSAAPGLQSLTLVAASINDTVPQASFTAGDISLQGNGSASQAAQVIAPVTGAQSLTFSAGEIDFGGPVGVTAAGVTPSVGAGALAINTGAHATTTFNATGSIVGAGGGTLAVNGNLALNAQQLTASAGSSASLAGTGNLSIGQQGTAASASSVQSSLGGGLSLSAQSIADSGSIIVPGGNIRLTATGGDLSLGSGAQLDASGIAVGVEDQTRGAAGGAVNLTAAGNVSLAQGSRINVAGALGAADGSLDITAGGTATIAGQLNGGSPADVTGGSLILYTGQLSGGLPSLVGTLSGFMRSINVESGGGDLDLLQGQVLTANQVVLSADGGAIDIAGTIAAASADTRGSIGLFANGNVTLDGSGTLSAEASTVNDDASGRGGTIELATVSGTVNLPASNATAAGIITSGPQQVGTLILRAPTMNGDDVAVSQIDTTLRGVGQILVEPVLQTADFTHYGNGAAPTGDFTTSTNWNRIANTVNGYVSAAADVVPAHLLPQSSGQGTQVPQLILEPGVVLVEPINTTLTKAVDLSTLDTPIDLTVRAANSLNISANFNDGVSGGSLLDQAQSSSLHFVAGANVAGADPLAILPGKAATLTLGTAGAKTGKGAILQTSTGNIDLVSSGNVVINTFSGAYTTGVAPAASTGAATGTVTGAGNYTYMVDGGNVSVEAGGSITAAPVQENISAWLAFGSTNSGSASVGVWGTNLAAYAANPWSVATLGGGDVRISAGGNVTTLSAAAAGGMNATPTTQTEYASGGLDVTAGGNVTTGQFYLAEGSGTLTAGGAFNTSPFSVLGLSAPLQVGSLFAMQDSQVALWAQDGIAISAIGNPTDLLQPKAAGTAATLSFLTYGADSSFSAQASAGDVVLANNSNILPYFTGKLPGSQANNTTTVYSILPGTVYFNALGKDVDLSSGAATLFPSASGQLGLFASRDIIGGSSVAMSDAPPGAFATGANTANGGLGVIYNFDASLHASNDIPAEIVAGRDISNLSLSLPEPAHIEAGQDISNLMYHGENLAANDMTLISAGRDISYPLFYGVSGIAVSGSSLISVGGPGSLDLLAGRNINLGFDNGVITTGNTTNGNLAPGGASINMIMGLGQQPDYGDFLTKVIEPSTSYSQQLVSYVESITGQTGLTTDQALTEFTASGTPLSAPQRDAFLDQVFFNELNLSGIENNTVPGAGYTRGYNAIATLFPGTPTALGQQADNAFNGSLDLIYSQVYTEDGGGITLL